MSSSSSKGHLIFIVLLGAFLAGCTSMPEFDGRSAYRYLESQTDFGPRNPGSEGHRQCREYLKEEMSRLADTVLVQDFSIDGVPGPLTNVIAMFNTGDQNRMLLCAHWDTRPWADRDPDPANRQKPIVGADDGASGVAVLLELARVLSREAPPRGVEIVFFDAEDSGTPGKPETYCLGSAYYAKNMPGTKPAYGILLDMIGDSDLQVYVEQNSYAAAPYVVDLINSCGKGSAVFHQDPKHMLYDDHVNLIAAGIPSAVIIDFDYPYWHTLGDTPDKCSPQSLKAIGELLLKIVYR
jgi:Iap family predicted aminopeptidase